MTRYGGESTWRECQTTCSLLGELVRCCLRGHLRIRYLRDLFRYEVPCLLEALQQLSSKTSSLKRSFTVHALHCDCALANSGALFRCAALHLLRLSPFRLVPFGPTEHHATAPQMLAWSYICLLRGRTEYIHVQHLPYMTVSLVMFPATP